MHAFVNEIERPIGTYLYGRRMYAVMRSWETLENLSEQPPEVRDFAMLWRAADKVVYSATLATISSARTRIERKFDAESVRELKESATRALSVGGPELAGHAIAAGLVDECHLFLTPVIVGGGNQALPADVRVDLELVDERRFGNGVVHLHYRFRR